MLSKTIFLGIIQGITEFLPISSTAHLAILQRLFDFSSNLGIFFDLSLHLGSVFALLFYFDKEIIKLFKNLRILVIFLVATLPAGIFGFLIEDEMGVLRQPKIIAAMLIVFSLYFFLAEKFSSQKKKMTDFSFRDGFLVGLSQSLALIPGVSRSGVTLASSMLLGYKREESGKFVFLLSIPIILGASLTGIFRLVRENILFTPLNMQVFSAGIISSFLASLWIIKFFLSYLQKKTLYPFIAYRLILALFLLAFL